MVYFSVWHKPTVQEHPTILNKYCYYFPKARFWQLEMLVQVHSYRQEYLVMSEGREAFIKVGLGYRKGKGSQKRRKVPSTFRGGRPGMN